jgi:DNA invertase Pin-like site-specific DNA recombinase
VLEISVAIAPRATRTFCATVHVRHRALLLTAGDWHKMVRGILLAVLATMAKQEAKRLSERVLAGMARARAKGTRSGKPIGRPRVDDKTERAIRASLKAGTGINKTAAGVGVGVATVQRIKAEMLAPPC